MKKLITPLLAALALAGCVVESVYPWYAAKDVVFDPKLVGRWVEAAATNTPPEAWTFEKLDANTYSLTTTDEGKTNRYEAHLFCLAQGRFLDVCLTNRAEGQLPVHYLLTVAQLEPTLQTAVIKYDWLTKFLEKNPGALRHLVVPNEPGETNGGLLVLTADTKELQKFIRQHLSDTNAFDPLGAMKRRAE